MARTEAHQHQPEPQAETGPVLLWSTDPAGRCTWVSDEWLRFTGRSAEETLGEGWIEAVVPEDRGTLDDVFVSALVARETFEVRYRLRRRDGELRRMLDRGGPMLEDGELRGWVGGAIDIDDHRERTEAHITDRMQVEEDRQELLRRASLLAETAQVLESTHEPDEILVDLARVLASRLADWCVIDVIDPESGELRRIASAHHDSASALHVERVAQLWLADPARDAGPGHVLRTGQAELVSPVSAEALRDLTAGDEERHLLAGLDLRSMVCVPLSARGVTLGVITLATLGADWELDATDLSLAADIGRRAGLAVDNARLHAALQSQHDLYQTLLRAQTELGEGYVLLSAERVLYCNAAAEEIAGRTLADLRDLRSLFELLPPEEHRRVAAWAYDVWQGENAAPNLETVVLRPDGTRVEVEAGAFPIHGEGDTQVVCVLRDIGERRSQEAERQRLLRRTSLLNAVAHALEQSLDLTRSMRDVTTLITQELCDYATIDVIGRDERSVQRVAVSCRDPREDEIVAALASFPVELDSEHPAAVAVRERAPWFPAADGAIQRRTAQDDPEHLAVIRRAQVVRIGSLPLMTGDRCLGAVSLGWTTDGPAPEGHELELLEALARRIALGVSNGLLYREREQVASTLQRSLLPPELPALPGFDVAARYEPADRASEVGGDFYDLFPCDEGRWALVVGDVCGKGADAAALTAMARYTLRAAFLGDDGRPARALGLLNRAVQRENDPERFLTAVLGIVHAPTGEAAERRTRLTLSVAGHPSPIVLRADGSADMVAATGPVVGVFDPGAWGETEVELRPGDTLLLYTDGVTEASRSAPLNERELATRIAVGRPKTAEEAASAVERVARRRSGGALRDDLVVVALRMR